VSAPASPSTRSAFRTLWDELAPVGRDPRTGGYARFAWTREDASLREWFTGAARARGLDVDVDRNGNIWAWWGRPGPDSVVTGSHLDSVPGGGAYDGPLGVVASLLAVDELRARGVRPSRPLAVVCFADEEGARFGVACVGSRLLTGTIDRDRALQLRDVDGVSLAEALAAAGVDPDRAGRDDEALQRIGAFVELHVEQGRGLVDLGAPVGLAASIWPHGRWRGSFSGEGNHAGTTRLADRRDPMLPFAGLVLGAREAAAELGALLTVGRVLVDPNGTNAIPVTVDAWVDARAPEEDTVRELIRRVERLSREAAERHGVRLSFTEESWSGTVEFDSVLRDRLAGAVGAAAAVGDLGSVPVLGTGAGHDAGVLAARVPTAMLFVRNPSGVSHSPAEFAEDDDCVVGVRALAAALEELLTS
jgi:N-carbamoyl-L-amino-acid hydrolase